MYLCELRGFPGAGLPHHDDDVVVSDDGQQLLASSVDGQELALLTHALGLGKLTHSLTTFLDVVRELLLRLVAAARIVFHLAILQVDTFSDTQAKKAAYLLIFHFEDPLPHHFVKLWVLLY